MGGLSRNTNVVSAGRDTEPCVSGTIVVYHRGALEADLGSQTVTRALGQLSPEERREIVDALPVSWVRHTTFEGLYRESALLAGRDIAALHTDIVRRGVEHRVRHLWRILLRLSDADALAARAKMFYEKSYSAGQVLVGETDSGRSSISVKDWPKMPEMAIRGVRVGTQTLLKLAGLKNAVVASEECPDGALFRLTWEG